LTVNQESLIYLNSTGLYAVVPWAETNG
jgi:hypothetical protein